MNEKRRIIFVLTHCRRLTQAAVYLAMKVGALRARRKKYGLLGLARNSDGPVLSHAEMDAAFRASLGSQVVATAATLEVLGRSVTVTLAPPGGPIVNVPLSAVLPRATG